MSVAVKGARALHIREIGIVPFEDLLTGDRRVVITCTNEADKYMLNIALGEAIQANGLWATLQSSMELEHVGISRVIIPPDEKILLRGSVIDPAGSTIEPKNPQGDPAIVPNFYFCELAQDYYLSISHSIKGRSRRLITPAPVSQISLNGFDIFRPKPPLASVTPLGSARR